MHYTVRLSSKGVLCATSDVYDITHFVWLLMAAARTVHVAADKWQQNRLVDATDRRIGRIVHMAADRWQHEQFIIPLIDYSTISSHCN